MKILNFGSANIDHVYRTDRFVRPGETKQCAAYRKNSGGKGLNQSVALAKAGAEVYHAGLLGGEGAFLRDILMTSGVDCRFLKTVDAPSGHAIIEVEDSGQNRIMIFPGTNRMLTEDYADAVFSYFAAGDILLLQNETNLVSYLMRRAAEKGMRIAFNAAPMDAAVPDFPLELVSWLLVNETEGEALTGERVPEKIAERAAERWPDTALVLTLGTDGCLYRDADQMFRLPARKVNAVDATAAGDTFTGFFLAAIASSVSPKYALRLATAASAIAVTRPGAAASVPTLAKAKAFLD